MVSAKSTCLAIAPSDKVATSLGILCAEMVWPEVNITPKKDKNKINCVTKVSRLSVYCL